MAEPNAFDRNNPLMQPLGPPPGLLEQFNLPPALIRFIRRNQRAVWTVLTAVLVLIVAIAGWTTYRDYRAGKAASALDAALNAKADQQKLLEQVAAKYSSTPSGLWANLELAFLKDKEGQHADAMARFETISNGLPAKSLLKPLVLSKLGALYENGKQLDKALASYTALASMEGFAAEAYRAMGRIYEIQGKPVEAKGMYEKYMEKTAGPDGQPVKDPVRELVQVRLNQIKN